MQSKSELRRQARETRKTLLLNGLDDIMIRRLSEHPAMAGADHVLLYAPLTDEINLLGLMAGFTEKTFYLPRITPDNRLDFHRYRPGDELEIHRYGMPEPLASSPALAPEAENILVVTPALMADKRGFRLGYGQSFYDRFLGVLRQECKSITAIAALPDVLLTETLPTDPWDEPVDWIITEERILCIPT